ncbi:MAG: Asp23/Gls24 family envelope stress response protein [Anaerolineae bacterium]
MSEETNLGRIEISPKAIASLAVLAVLECYGVVGMAPKSAYRGWGYVLSRDHYRRGVDVHIIDGRIIIDLYVVIEFGLRISEVAHNIMSTVKFSMEKALGVPVSEVNVHVQGLRVSGE